MDKKLQDKLDSKDQFARLCSYLAKRYSEDERRKRIAKTGEVLAMIGRGILFAGLLFSPRYSRLLSFKDENNPTWAELNKYSKYYNLPALRRTLKRLEKQKMVVIKETPEQQIVELTEKGKTRILRYAVGEFNIRKQDRWDGKWRIIIYDVSDKRKRSRDILRSTLQRMGFLKLQKSVYLFPFPCGEEIEFLRAYYGLDQEVTMLVTSKIENDDAYRKYFGI